MNLLAPSRCRKKTFRFVCDPCYIFVFDIEDFEVYEMGYTNTHSGAQFLFPFFIRHPGRLWSPAFQIYTHCAGSATPLSHSRVADVVCIPACTADKLLSSRSLLPRSAFPRHAAPCPTVPRLPRAGKVIVLFSGLGAISGDSPRREEQAEQGKPEPGSVLPRFSPPLPLSQTIPNRPL